MILNTFERLLNVINSAKLCWSLQVEGLHSPTDMAVTDHHAFYCGKKAEFSQNDFESCSIT